MNRSICFSIFFTTRLWSATSLNLELIINKRDELESSTLLSIRHNILENEINDKGVIFDFLMPVDIISNFVVGTFCSFFYDCSNKMIWLLTFLKKQWLL